MISYNNKYNDKCIIENSKNKKDLESPLESEMYSIGKATARMYMAKAAILTIPNTGRNLELNINGSTIGALTINKQSNGETKSNDTSACRLTTSLNSCPMFEHADKRGNNQSPLPENHT